MTRPAEERDLPTLVDFQKRMAMETENLLLNEPVLVQGIARLFSDPSRGRYYVAEREGRVVGSLMITYEWSDWRNGTILWIQSVFVDTAFRGQGVYAEMYRHIQQLVAGDPALKGIRLYVEKSNLAAQAVYAKLGMDGEHYKVFEWMK